MTQPATTAPEINTDYIRSIVAGSEVCDTRFLTEALDAVDTLRKHFAAQQDYIAKLERTKLPEKFEGTMLESYITEITEAEAK